MLPVVAIVGRPNVGKSTLFNRLTRSRKALISDYPGTTRDRQYGQVDQLNRRFIIVDTGGMTDEHVSVSQLVNQQAQQAIQEADKILFLIDAKTGITPDDQQIANLLRKSGKPIYLVANKAEGLAESASLEASELGFVNVSAIAALPGLGIDDLIMQLFPEEAAETTEEATPGAIKFAIVGRPNVGKSTLTNRMLGEERVIVHDSPGTTRDSISIPMSRHDQPYLIIDTAGVRRKKNIAEVPEKFSVIKTLQTIEQSHVVVYVIDARAGVAEQDLRLLGFIIEAGKGLVIAINKWDNMTESERAHTKQSIDRQIDFINFARIEFISALHGTGVGHLFPAIDEAYKSANRKLSTPLLSRLLEEAQATHQPPLIKGRRVKLRYAHLGGNNPPRIIIHGTQVTALPESYRKFLAHFFQKKLQLFGTPIFIEFKVGKNPYASKRKKG